MEERGGYRSAYRTLCSIVGQMPSPRVVGNSTAYRHVVELVEQLEWFEVFDLLEEYAPHPGQHQDHVNEWFSKSGLAYELTSSGIQLLDAEGRALEVDGVEQEAMSMLDGRFDPVREQYQKALTALNSRPADLEKAISESVGALEAVASIISGKKDFAPAVDVALKGRNGLQQFGQSLKNLYNFASQTPGVRHGRKAEPDLVFAEARMIVRQTGVAVAYLIETASGRVDEKASPAS